MCWHILRTPCVTCLYDQRTSTHPQVQCSLLLCLLCGECPRDHIGETYRIKWKNQSQEEYNNKSSAIFPLRVLWLPHLPNALRTAHLYNATTANITLESIAIGRKSLQLYHNGRIMISQLLQHDIGHPSLQRRERIWQHLVIPTSYNVLSCTIRGPARWPHFQRQILPE